MNSFGLTDNKITDVAPLAGLTKSKKLRLRDANTFDEEIEMLKKALPICKIVEE